MWYRRVGVASDFAASQRKGGEQVARKAGMGGLGITCKRVTRSILLRAPEQQYGQGEV